MHQNMILRRRSHQAVSLLVWLSLLASAVFLRSSGLESVHAAHFAASQPLIPANLCSETGPKICYVDKDAPGPTHSGDDWTNALTNLQGALDLVVDGDQIWVAAGIYTPTHQILTTDTRTATFSPVDGVQIYGGFNGDETSLSQRDWRAHPSILSGDLNGDDVVDTFENNAENSYHVVNAGNLDKTSTRLDGFIIQGGNANINNEARKIAYGGGLYNNNNLGSPSMANLIFYKNYALVGGGLYNINADALVVNVSWIGNQADFGAAVRNIDCSPTLVNALFIGNVAEYVGGAIYNSNGQPNINNCTAANNSTRRSQGEFGGGGAVFNDKITHLYLNNCILWGNTSGADTPDQVYNEEIPGDLLNSSYTELHSSLYPNGCSGFGSTCYEAEVKTDPLFVNLPGLDGIIGTLDDNVRLMPGSPAINAGDNTNVGLDDLDINNNGIITETLPYDLDYAKRFVQAVPGYLSYLNHNTPPVVDLGVYESTPILFMPLIRK
jgi:hypothetical protein